MYSLFADILPESPPDSGSEHVTSPPSLLEPAALPVAAVQQAWMMDLFETSQDRPRSGHVIFSAYGGKF
jgi:hypothetical protein